MERICSGDRLGSAHSRCAGPVVGGSCATHGEAASNLNCVGGCDSLTDMQPDWYRRLGAYESDRWATPVVRSSAGVWKAIWQGAAQLSEAKLMTLVVNDNVAGCVAEATRALWHSVDSQSNLSRCLWLKVRISRRSASSTRNGFHSCPISDSGVGLRLQELIIQMARN